MLDYAIVIDKFYKVVKQVYKIPHWLAFSIVYLIYFIDSYSELDPDFGWHVKSGEQILNHGIPSHDIFTYTASDFPWIGHEWLNDSIVYILNNFGGYFALSLVFAGLWTLSMKIATGRASGMLPIIASISTIPFSGVRTLTWTMLGVATLLWVLRDKSKKYLNYTPLLFLVWSNIHGSFVIGFIIILYYALFSKSKKLLFLLILSSIASLINPYGWKVYEEIFRTLTDTTLRSNITEWGFLRPNHIIILYPIVWLSGYIYFNNKGWRRFVSLPVLLFVLSLNSNRMFPIFVLVSLFDFFEFSKKFAHDLPKQINKIAKLIISVVGTIFLIVPICIYLNEIKNLKFDRESDYPSRIASYLNENPCHGNTFNHYDFGGYLIWKVPIQKVYIDGRMPSWSLNGLNYMQRYNDVLKNTDIRKNEFYKFNIKCAVLTKNGNLDSKIRKELLAEGWIMIVSDERAALLVSEQTTTIKF